MAVTYMDVDPFEAKLNLIGSVIHQPVPWETSRPPYQQLLQKKAKITLSPYLAVAGTPVLDTGYGVKCDTSCYVDTGGITQGSGYPTPAAAVTGADFRFLPSAAYTAVNSAQANALAWFGVGKNITTYPQLVTRKRTATQDPVISTGYSYEWNHKRIALPSFTMNGSGYFEIITGAGASVNYSKATILMVIVPHAGAGRYYPLYDSGKITTLARRFSMIYRKGVIELYGAGGRLLEHKVSLDHSEPIIVGFSYDGTAKTGRFVCADKRRVSRTFNSYLLDGMDMNAFIGVKSINNGSTTPDWNYAADMDVMEVDIWLNRALDFRELEDVVTLLSSVYRVGP